MSVLSNDCLPGKMCAHTMLALLHMKLSGHPQFATAYNRRVPASTAKSDGKDSKDGDEAKVLPISHLHRKQALYELEHCRLMEDSADVRKGLNRRCVPGDCPLRSSCPSIGKTTDKHGLSRGSRACEHSFPSELHVGLQRCPDRACGASRLQLFCLMPCRCISERAPFCDVVESLHLQVHYLRHSGLRRDLPWLQTFVLAVLP